MEVEYEHTVDSVMDFLREIGEDPEDYTCEQIENMIKKGF